MATTSFAPVEALLDQPVAINVSGVKPGSRVRIRVRSHSLNAESSAEFIANGDGLVNTDAAELFWSAGFDPGSDVTSMINTLSRLEPLAYRATVSVDGTDEASSTFTRRLLAEHVVRTPVRDGRLRGTLFAPRGATNAPGIVVLGGSDGGNLYEFVAALLAGHGLAALSLAYFAHEDLPKELIEIPIEYFGEAIQWLRVRPEVGDARVGVLGFSRGGECALLLGATFPDVAAVVALVPSGLTGGGIGADFSAMSKSAWTLGGKPLPLLPPPWDPISMKEAQQAFSSGKPLAARAGILRALESAGAGRIDEVAIRVERTRGAILMMSGEDDQLWGSTQLTAIAEARLEAARFAYPFEHVRYAGAGHFACLPPGLPTTSTAARHPQVPMSLEFGGNARDNAAASADLWPRIVAFLHQHLDASA